MNPRIICSQCYEEFYDYEVALHHIETEHPGAP